MAPKLRFRCHCTKCQQTYQAPYADALFVRRGQAVLAGASDVKWIKTIKHSPLNRGICRGCGAPVLGHFFGAFSIVPAYMVDRSTLPTVQRDIYYVTRVKDLADDIPKHSGHLSSYLGLALPVTGVLVSSGQ